MPYFEWSKNNQKANVLYGTVVAERYTEKAQTTTTK
jgi:hypothetical protein